MIEIIGEIREATPEELERLKQEREEKDQKYRPEWQEVLLKKFLGKSH